MDERTKRFELLSDLYHFLHNAPAGEDRSRATLQWILNYSHIGPEKLFLAGLEHDVFVPLAEAGGSAKHREPFRGRVIPHIEVVRQTRQPVLFRDLMEDGDASLREWAMQEDIHTFWVFPVIGRGMVMGSLGVAYPEVRTLEDLELQYWTRVSETLAIFIALIYRRHERQLEQERFSTALEMSQAGVLGFRADGEVAFHNQRFLEMFYLRSEDVHGHYRDVLDRISNQIVDPRAVVRDIQQALEQAKAVRSFEIVSDLKGVIPRKIRMRVRPLGRGDRIDGWVALFDDYTQEHSVKTQQQAFLSLVAHEFRTPITVIAGVAEWLMAEAEGNALLTDQMRIIARETTRLMRLIRELWLSVHLDDAGWQTEASRVCVAEVVREESSSRQSNVPLKPITYQGPSHAYVQGSREVIMTIVSVLLSNAVRFSPPDAPIDVTVTPTEDGVRVEVADRGPGVDPAVVDDLFVRMPDPRKRSAVGGIGIGLWLTRQLLDRLGGDVQYQPRLGGGAVFTVWFPSRPRLASSS
ncbi:sensor histidine kinase [Sulfobacillus harzensis]|uniref:histidine kinase n=1 Tax=Sulfobacillus harzensis TaxID=2729629 RepID=A0A7Y0L2P3_9FIRM|nr:ATP-binding protein [Sulfobacillus harzensis]NMP22090.1 GAF domain-containing protein [Sulfobacillus harzensis]